MDIEEELKRLRDERQKKFNEEDWEGALKVHDRILELSPSALRYANRGSILYRLGRLSEAIESYHQALDMDPSLKRARADLERLEAQYQKQIEENDGVPPLTSAQESFPSESKEKRNEFFDGEEGEDKQKNEKHRQEKINLLRVQRQQAINSENWQEALNLHNQILEYEPTASRYMNQGSILYRLGRVNDAITSYRKALELDPNLEKARIDLERLESQVEEEKLLSLPKINKPVDIQKRIEELRKERQEKIAKEDWQGALKIHDDILGIEPTGLRYANKGALLYRMNRLKEALDCYNKAISLDPTLVKIKQDIEHLESQLEEEQLSVHLSESQMVKSVAQEMTPEERNERIEQLKQERQKYLDVKDWDKALQLHDEIIRLEPTALRYVNRGSMLYRMQRIEDAIESYRKALELDPNLGRAKTDLERMEKELSQKKPVKVSSSSAPISSASVQAPPIAPIPAPVSVAKPSSAASKSNTARLPVYNPNAKVNVPPPAVSLSAKLEELRQLRQQKIQENKWEEALHFQDEIVRLEPTGSRYATRGSILYRLNRINDAILSYRKALDLEPNLEQAKRDLKNLQDSEMERLRQERQQKMEEEDWPNALALHDVILALEPSALRYANRGSILYRMQRIQDAVAAYQKALELDPNLKQAQEDLAQLQEEIMQNASPGQIQEDD